MRFKTVTDLSTSFNPVPKNERKKNKKLIDDKKHNCEYCGKKNCWTNKHHIKSKRSRRRRHRGQPNRAMWSLPLKSTQWSN